MNGKWQQRWQRRHHLTWGHWRSHTRMTANGNTVLRVWTPCPGSCWRAMRPVLRLWFLRFNRKRLHVDSLPLVVALLNAFLSSPNFVIWRIVFVSVTFHCKYSNSTIVSPFEFSVAVSKQSNSAFVWHRLDIHKVKWLKAKMALSSFIITS